MTVHVRGKWSGPLIMAATIVALLPPLAAAIHDRGLAFLASLALAAAVALLWQLTFEWVRGRPHTWSWAAIAVTFTVMIPPDLAYWQLGLAVTFGIVLAEQVFGGWGRNFLNPATVAMAFLLFSFPTTVAGPGSMELAITSAVSGAALLAAGLVSWRIIAGFAIAATAITFISTGSLGENWIPGGYVMFGLVFLICDPVSAAATNAGRWTHGALAGSLMVLLGQPGSGSQSVNTIVFAALLASLFAPLIDRIVIELYVRRRNWRHG